MIRFHSPRNKRRAKGIKRYSIRLLAMAGAFLSRPGIVTRLWVEPGGVSFTGTVLALFMYLHLYPK
jgi:hypothetical protein